MIPGTEPISTRELLSRLTPRFFTPINLRLADFAGVDKRSHACLSQAVAVLIHAVAQRRGFDAVLTAIFFVVRHAGLLQRFAIS